MAIGRVRMVLEVLADGAISLSEIALLKEGCCIGEKRFGLAGRLRRSGGSR